MREPGTLRRDGATRRARKLLAAAVLVCLLQPAPAARAQEVTTPALVAAVIVGIAKFTTWPADAFVDEPNLVFCVAGDPSVREELERLTRGRDIEGRPIVVRPEAPAGPFDGCHLLYLSGMSLARAVDAAGQVADRPVLTISDIPGFSRGGGITLLYFRQGRVAFHIDVDAARRSGIQISSRALVLSRQP
ncbi:MAG: YfiR family protein [Acidobacteriota bacterium]